MYGIPTSPLTLEQLDRLCHNGEWQRRHPQAEPSGFPALDASLPGGGWPMGALCELMPIAPGIGEISLLMPALSRLARNGRYLAWIAPPYLACAPALRQWQIPLPQVLVIRTRGVQESLWATEQALRCPAVGAALCWPAGITDRNVRRLQLAAEAGGGLGVLYRPDTAAREHSPAALRLRLRPSPADELLVDVHKCRGGRSGQRLQLQINGAHHALAVHTSAAACA